MGDLRGATAMTRYGALLLMILAVCGQLHADDSDPLTYRVYTTWNGAITVLTNPPAFVLHRSQPAWMSATPPISILRSDGQTERTGMTQEDIRNVVPWNNNLLIVRSDSVGCRVDLTTRKIESLRSWIMNLGARIEPGIDIDVHCSDTSPIAFIRIGSSLWTFNLSDTSAQSSLVEDRVRGSALLDHGPGRVAVVHDIGRIAYLSIIDSLMRRVATPSVPLALMARIEVANNMVLIVSPIDAERGTQITLVNTLNSSTRTMSVQAASDLIDAFVVNGGVSIAMLSQRTGRFELVTASPEVIGTENFEGTILPGEYGRPLALRVVKKEIIVLFSGGIVIADSNGNIISRNAHRFEVDPATLKFYNIQNGLLVSSKRGSALLYATAQPLWWMIRFIDSAGKYLIPIVFVLVVLTLFLQLRRQRRILDAMLEMPGSGLVFMVDAAGRLLRTNERGAKLLRISKNIPMRRVFHAYMRHDGVAGVHAYIRQALAERKPLSEKVVVDDGDEQREYVFTAMPLWGTVGRLRSIVIRAVDITEALERKRLVNWAQLAHDMQTNLSTIRLNAEQLEVDESGGNKERLRRILFQTSVLIQRVRDLVSVGRTEELSRSPVHSAEFCTQIRHEFDPLMFPNVTFQMKLRGAMMNVDRLKLSRAVRNAVENAIKSLRGAEGIVEIATWFDRTNVFIRISDTGVGMDTLTLENMMKPYFTTSKDGSGTGIGTMIMQHVTFLHGGTLRIASDPGVGTQVIFRIPHHMSSDTYATKLTSEGVGV